MKVEKQEEYSAYTKAELRRKKFRAAIRELVELLVDAESWSPWTNRTFDSAYALRLARRIERLSK